jgi:hypothetical protein
MESQLMFNMLIKQPLYELGCLKPEFFQFVDLNGYAVREKDIVEFNKLNIFERR